MNRPNINVTPLIDVLLVLLIIFMVISPTQRSSFKTKVPAEPKGGAPLEPNPNSLIVSLDAKGALRINQRDVSGTTDEPAQTIEDLRRIFQQRASDGIFRPGTNEIETTVFIKAPRNMNYGSVAKAVDAVKMSGAEPIGLQIDGL